MAVGWDLLANCYGLGDWLTDFLRSRKSARAKKPLARMTPNQVRLNE
jgi:hypothetical protein